MKVFDQTTRSPRVASPDDAIRGAAGAMAQADAGVPPVGDNDRLVCMVMDRGVAVSAVAEGKGPDTEGREVMTPDVQYRFEDEDLDSVARRMSEQRVPVMDRGKRLVGIFSLGGVAVGEGPRPSGEALSGVSRPGGARCQTGGERTGPGA